MIKIKSNHSLTLWLYFSAFMVFAMVVIGAITRLTESGLSIVEWKPLIGTLPPLSDAAWQAEFDLYKNSPEFQKKNFWMELSDFKQIYFWEWFHRLWGRLIGLVYALPLLYFWLKGLIPSGYKPRLLFIFFLGALQGFMGWYMVKSGLVDDPAVSHFRLAAHLSLAFFIFSCLIWTAHDISDIPKFKAPTALKIHAWGSLYLLIITIIWGAYVAGLDAGMIYNEFPLMGGVFFPQDAQHLSPLWVNFFENPVAIQFMHRWLGFISFLAIGALYFHAVKREIKTREVFALPLLVTLQVGLGVATLLTQVWLPLAVLHQANGLLLLGALVIFLRRLA